MRTATVAAFVACCALVHAGAKEEGEAFLANKATEPGVFSLPSGMLVKVLAKGSGMTPAARDSCKVHYKGTLPTGKQFDSSYDRGQPATFAPNQVIKGWTEALQLMCEGDKWELSIPFNLAYGAAGRMPNIPGYSPLLFDVELIEVNGGKGTACDRTALQELLGGVSYEEM
ncbi:Macrophage infectivity potentiator [Diplonema papillatum]|nr:Macrophage infectivity potentiator [Diplonema papillatum]|eukprot:gene16899-25917_t